jgi:hypothetical protein
VEVLGNSENWTERIDAAVHGFAASLTHASSSSLWSGGIKGTSWSIFLTWGACSATSPTCESGCHIATLLSAPNCFALITPLYQSL